MTQFIPNALCFGDQFPASGAPCLVDVEAHGLTLTFAAGLSGSQDERVPFSDITVTAGGLDHDQLVVKWKAEQGERTLYLNNPDLIRAFRQTAPDHLGLPFEQAAQKVRHMRHRRRMVWSVVGGTMLALALGLWFGADLLVELAVDRIP